MLGSRESSALPAKHAKWLTIFLLTCPTAEQMLMKYLERHVYNVHFAVVVVAELICWYLLCLDAAFPDNSLTSPLLMRM